MIDEYIAGFPPHVQKRPKKLRTTIKKAAPGSTRDRQVSNAYVRVTREPDSLREVKHPNGFYPAPNGIQKIQETAVSVSVRQGIRKVSAGPAHFLRPGQQAL